MPAPTDVEGSRFFACGYGYGWDVCDQENLPPEVGHTGELSTFHAWHRRFPEDEMVLVFFTNGNDSDGNGNWGFDFADELTEAYFE